MDSEQAERKMLIEFHERQMKTLEQGINDIQYCVRRNRLYVLFLYDNKTVVYGIINYMNSKYLTVKKQTYYYNKINRVYSYFTLQLLSIDLLKVWYEMEDEPEL
jgi:hypothetical protein